MALVLKTVTVIQTDVKTQINKNYYFSKNRLDKITTILIIRLFIYSYIYIYSLLLLLLQYGIYDTPNIKQVYKYMQNKHKIRTKCILVELMDPYLLYCLYLSFCVMVGFF